MTDPIVEAVRFLLDHGNLEWLRHRPEADEALRTIDACARVVRGIARGPAEQKYLGPCGAWVHAGDVALPVEDGHWEDVGVVAPCEGDVYAFRGARHGTCRTCGARHDAGQREAWLDGEVRQRAFTARAIADAYSLNVKTIRSWAERGQLVQRGIDRQLRPVYLVGDVLDLAAADAARRAEREAKKLRRAATAEDARMGA